MDDGPHTIVGMDAGNFTGLTRVGMRRRLDSLSSPGMVVFSLVLLIVLILAWIFL